MSDEHDEVMAAIHDQIMVYAHRFVMHPEDGAKVSNYYWSMSRERVLAALNSLEELGLILTMENGNPNQMAVKLLDVPYENLI